MVNKRHILLATFPAQGHINPSLEFAKRLLNTGYVDQVTFFTSVYALRRMRFETDPNIKIDFVAFSDSYDDGLKKGDDGKNYMSEMRKRGTKALKDTLIKFTDDEMGSECYNRVSFVVYSHLFSWAAEVAREVNVPSALLWIEPATVFYVYYFYFNGYADDIDAGSDQIQLPNLPQLSRQDLPSFLLPSSPARFRTLMKEKFDTLDKEPKAKVLINTFDALENEQLKAIDRYELISIGPLIPSSIFSDGKDLSSSKSYGGDLFRKPDETYIEWLNSKPESSVIYVSFGSLLRLPKPQMVEIAIGLSDTKLPVLWVIRRNEEGDEHEQVEEEEKLLSFFDHHGPERLGKIMTWCSQLDVLTHKSVGCFVTHCGWNSAIESLACGVPVVCFPQWFDQGTNAKMIEDVWRSGVRVRVNEEGGFVDRHEIKRCVSEVMDGEKSRELRENAMIWKGLAKEAMDEGHGSSMNNLKNFIDRIVNENV